jgi:alginate O-acetyltransferase complex protein AlgI
MQYTDRAYFAFLIAVFFGYRLIPDNSRVRAAFLVLVSYIFYAQAGFAPLLVLFAISCSGFLIGKSMAGKPGWARKLLVWLSLLIDIGALVFFKYSGVFSVPRNIALSAHLGHFGSISIAVLAPIGISFYTLQSVSYVVDIYRGDGESAHNLLEYLCFVSFFPTVISGPIVRAKQFLPRLRQPAPLTSELGGRALFLIAVGLIKKIAIADYLSANLTQRVFDFPDRFSSLEVLVAIYAFALQIYADFSGFTDIVIGSSMLLGIELPENFNAPYISKSLTEFWRRWHITFSTWLRDYIFFSFVAKWPRKRLALYAGLVITMLIGGLWHGLGWTFVIWGALHGVGLAIAHAFSEWRRRVNRSSPGDEESIDARSSIARRALKAALSCWPVLLTFHFVCLTWIFFRAETAGVAFQMLHQLAGTTLGAANVSVPIILVMAVGYLTHFAPGRLQNWSCQRFAALPAFGQATVLASVGVGLYLVASSDVAPFIYSRF